MVVATDPRAPQRRFATTPTGRLVAVEITGDDRLRLIRTLPGRWAEVIMARERGASLEDIAAGRVTGLARPRIGANEGCRGSCDPACLRCHMASIYTWLETELHEVAARRARLMV